MTYIVTVTVLVGVEVVRMVLEDQVVAIVVVDWDEGETIDVIEFLTEYSIGTRSFVENNK